MAYKRGVLTPKQALFVEHYVGTANYNATEAARLAGYSENTCASIGWENTQKPLIKAAIQDRLKAITSVITPEAIAAGLFKIANTPADGTIVKTSDQNTALRTLAQYKEMLTEKIEIEQTVTYTVNIEAPGLEEDELDDDEE